MHFRDQFNHVSRSNNKILSKSGISKVAIRKDFQKRETERESQKKMLQLLSNGLLMRKMQCEKSVAKNFIVCCIFFS